MSRSILVVTMVLASWLGWACDDARPLSPTPVGAGSSTPAPPGLTLRVTVNDGEDGKPIVWGGVAIAEGPNAHPGFFFPTDTNGEYVFRNLVASIFTVRAWHLAYEESTQRVELDRDGTVRFSLRPTTSLGPGTSRLAWDGAVGPDDENGCLDFPPEVNTNCRAFSFIALGSGRLTVVLSEGTSRLALYGPGPTPVAQPVTDPGGSPVRIVAEVVTRVIYRVTVSRHFLQPAVATFHLAVEGPPMRSLPLTATARSRFPRD